MANEFPSRAFEGVTRSYSFLGSKLDFDKHIKGILDTTKKSIDLICKLRNFLSRSSRTKYSKMDQVKYFKGCLPQILLGPFLNTLSHLFRKSVTIFLELIYIAVILSMIKLL